MRETERERERMRREEIRGGMKGEWMSERERDRM